MFIATTAASCSTLSYFPQKEFVFLKEKPDDNQNLLAIDKSNLHHT